MVHVWRLLTVGLLVAFPGALYSFWFRRPEWTRPQRLYRTFALLTNVSGLLLFGEAAGIRLSGLLDLTVLGVAWVSLVLWVYFGAKVRRERPA